MNKMQKVSITKARNFIYSFARPLERALYEYHFECGDANTVLGELTLFQNDDGGFGHALEPDFRLPASSVLATSIALQVLREINAPPENMLVRKAIMYLLRQYDPDRNAWHNVPTQVNDYPHAPWWHFKPEHGLTYSEKFQANAGAEIIGHFWHYHTLIDPILLATFTDMAMECLHMLSDEMEMHDILCYLWLVEARHFPEHLSKEVLEKLKKTVLLVVEIDTQKWSDYCAKPLWFAPFSHSPLAGVLHDEIQKQIDYELTQQQKDGAWLPFWSWNNSFTSEWEQAKQEWKGIITLKMFRSLRSYQKIP